MWPEARNDPPCPPRQLESLGNMWKDNNEKYLMRLDRVGALQSIPRKATHLPGYDCRGDLCLASPCQLPGRGCICERQARAGLLGMLRGKLAKTCKHATCLLQSPTPQCTTKTCSFGYCGSPDQKTPPVHVPVRCTTPCLGKEASLPDLPPGRQQR